MDPAGAGGLARDPAGIRSRFAESSIGGTTGKSTGNGRQRPEVPSAMGPSGGALDGEDSAFARHSGIHPRPTDRETP